MTDFYWRNGEFVTTASAAVGELFSADYVYQTMQVRGYRPRRAAEHLELLRAAALRLYGEAPGLGAPELERVVASLLRRNHYPEGCCEADVLFRVVDGRADTLVTAGAISVYDGCEIAALYPRAIVTGYDIPFEGLATGFSRSAADYAAGYAARSGADMAIRARRSGEITGAGEWPLFGVRNRTLVTPSLESGARDSVERRTVLEVAGALRDISVSEESISAGDLAAFSELFTCTPQGITAVDSCGSVRYLRAMVLLVASGLGGLR